MKKHHIASKKRSPSCPANVSLSLTKSQPDSDPELFEEGIFHKGFYYAKSYGQLEASL